MTIRAACSPSPNPFPNRAREPFGAIFSQGNFIDASDRNVNDLNDDNRFLDQSNDDDFDTGSDDDGFI